MHSVRFSHKDSEDITLVIEPWATEVPMVAGKSYQLTFTDDGSHPPDLEIVFSADERVLYAFGWPGSSFSIYEDGRDLEL